MGLLEVRGVTRHFHGVHALNSVNPTLAREIGERLQVIAAEGVTLLLIEHQIDMITRLCSHVIVMAEGRRLTEGSFAEIAADRAVQDAYMGRPRWAS
jgi:branched-chain amino acid transport system ATP-binding protein/neutral amino acid transport system ATP-binding protein